MDLIGIILKPLFIFNIWWYTILCG